MYGAIIGDLAAWTYRHEKDVFKAQLVSPEAKLSEVGLAVLAMDKMMRELKPDVEWEKIVSTFKEVLPPQSNEVATVVPVWTEFLKGTPHIPNRVKRVALLATDIVAGWQDDPREAAFAWGRRFHGTKEEHYTEQIAEIICRLRHGASKQEAMQGIVCIEDWTVDGNDFVGPLCYAHQAWRCFDEAADFDEAIRKAMQSPLDDPYRLAALSGAFAEAMWGCPDDLRNRCWGVICDLIK